MNKDIKELLDIVEGLKQIQLSKKYMDAIKQGKPLQHIEDIELYKNIKLIYKQGMEDKLEELQKNKQEECIVLLEEKAKKMKRSERHYLLDGGEERSLIRLQVEKGLLEMLQDRIEYMELFRKYEKPNPIEEIDFMLDVVDELKEVELSKKYITAIKENKSLENVENKELYENIKLIYEQGNIDKLLDLQASKQEEYIALLEEKAKNIGEGGEELLLGKKKSCIRENAEKGRLDILQQKIENIKQLEEERQKKIVEQEKQEQLKEEYEQELEEQLKQKHLEEERQKQLAEQQKEIEAQIQRHIEEEQKQIVEKTQRYKQEVIRQKQLEKEQKQKEREQRNQKLKEEYEQELEKQKLSEPEKKLSTRQIRREQKKIEKEEKRRNKLMEEQRKEQIKNQKAIEKERKREQKFIEIEDKLLKLLGQDVSARKLETLDDYLERRENEKNSGKKENIRIQVKVDKQPNLENFKENNSENNEKTEERI